MCTGHVRATGRPMGMRVLGSRKWSRPGKVGAGCDALVLRLHATHVQGGAGALGCAAMRAKGGVAWGGGTWFSTSDSRAGCQASNGTSRAWYHCDDLNEHVLKEPTIVS